jgi:hypothetical protein
MVVSLALGIGANAAVFSAVNTFVLKPLPVGQPEHLLAVQGRPGLSFPDYRDLRDRNSSLTALAGYRMAPMNLEIAAGPVRTWGYLATGNHFDALGVEPAVGRFFHAGDERGEGDVPFVVLSHDCWTARFGGDPGVVGRVLHINRFPFTVLGVAPKAFRGTELFYRPDVWVPMMMEPQIEVGHPPQARGDPCGRGRGPQQGRLRARARVPEGERRLPAAAVETRVPRRRARRAGAGVHGGRAGPRRARAPRRLREPGQRAGRPRSGPATGAGRPYFD